MRKQTAIIISIAIILIALATWWIVSAASHNADTEAAPTSSTQTTDEPAAISDTPSALTIVFTDDGFEQDSYSVGAGQVVTVVNRSSIDMEFSSDDHPSHRDNPELNMNSLAPGEEISFTPRSEGEWGIHDHLNPRYTTTLVVSTNKG